MSCPIADVPACPDCGAVPEDNLFLHEDTCPLLEALESTVAADRVWFVRHPSEVKRRRPTTTAERSELALLGGLPDQQVTVSRIAPGKYIRTFTPSGASDLIVVPE